jgi:murein DD-endopeptidase MepM/ murein hydrolase activator NlpD
MSRTFPSWGFLAVCLALLGVSACRQPSTENVVTAAPKPPVPKLDTVELKVRPGDTYAGLMRHLDLEPERVSNIYQQVVASFPVKLYAGQLVSMVFRRPPEGGEPRLLAFSLEERGGLFRHVMHQITDSADSLMDTLAYRGDSAKIRVDTVAVRGQLLTNLSEAVASQGESPALLDQIVQVFAWDIDFFRDPRVGDEYAVLVEKRYRDDGLFLGYGDLLTARYHNQGRTFEAYRYLGGYYDGQGQSLEKLLMKAPLKFSRISSGFTHSRLHPVLGIRRPHWGVDYAAPTGTPVYAAGDGVVVTASWSGGFGHCVKIRHNSVFTTYYGHLSGYAKSIRPGTRVSQGQTIGFVGSTGLASGPHLDYRVQRNGGFINPISLNTEAKAGIPPDQLAAFILERQKLVASLESHAQGNPVATNQGVPSPDSTLSSASEAI